MLIQFPKTFPLPAKEKQHPCQYIQSAAGIKSIDLSSSLRESRDPDPPFECCVTLEKFFNLNLTPLVCEIKVLGFFF